MSNFNAPAFSLRSRLKEFEQFQEFCLKYEHGIRPINTKNEQAFQPRLASTFIYSFFVFNDIYKINWEKSLEKPDDDPTECQNMSQQEMFWNLASFCFKNQPKRIMRYSKQLVQHCRQLDVDNAASELKKISVSKNKYLTDKIINQYHDRQNKGKEVSMQSISDFQDSFSKLYDHGTQQNGELPDGLTHINNMLYFIYLVRCSVFHGSKPLTVADPKRDQDVRLAIYAASVIAINQIAIETANQGIR